MLTLMLSPSANPPTQCPADLIDTIMMVEYGSVDRFEQAMDDHPNAISRCRQVKNLCQHADDQARSALLLAAHNACQLRLSEVIAPLKILHGQKRLRPHKMERGSSTSMLWRIWQKNLMLDDGQIKAFAA